MVNFTIIRGDATTVTGQADDWTDAADAIVRMIHDPKYRVRETDRVFTGIDGRTDTLQEYTIGELQRERAVPADDEYEYETMKCMVCGNEQVANVSTDGLPEGWLLDLNGAPVCPAHRQGWATTAGKGR